MKKRHKAMQESETHVRSMIQESLANIPVIKSFETEDHIVNNLDSLQKTYYQSVLKKQKLTMITSFGMTGFLALGYGLAIVFGAIRLSTDAISIGGLVAIIQLIGYLQSPFSGISQLIPKYYQMTASIERMKVLDDLASDVKNEIDVNAFDCITANHLSFSYLEDYIIKDLSFTINRGDIIQITGPSGKGKTTLLKLMLSLYQPTSGDLSIEIGKHKESLSPSFRKLFSYVPQNHMIMSGTIKENLSFYQEASDNQLWQVLSFVNLDDDIRKLPLSLNTKLGEKGVGLSEGQLQRLAIARALLKDAPIILLDEITSALDEKTEQHVLKNIQTLAHKTIIIISHRHLPDDFIKTYINL
jgi:ATP-binding cassette subfamily B protein